MEITIKFNTAEPIEAAMLAPVLTVIDQVSKMQSGSAPTVAEAVAHADAVDDIPVDPDPPEEPPKEPETASEAVKAPKSTNGEITDEHVREALRNYQKEHDRDSAILILRKYAERPDLVPKKKRAKLLADLAVKGAE